MKLNQYEEMKISLWLRLGLMNLNPWKREMKTFPIITENQ